MASGSLKIVKVARKSTGVCLHLQLLGPLTDFPFANVSAEMPSHSFSWFKVLERMYKDCEGFNH